jgi:HK97 family phage portal protein
VSLWDDVAMKLALRPRLRGSDLPDLPQARAIDSFTDYPGLTEQLLRIQGLSPRPWKAAGLRDALGVPAIAGATTLIAKTIGSMTMRALKNEVEIPPEDRPRLIIRPDPFRTANLFYFQTGWNIATRGEAWWWVAKRDADGNAISIINVDPAQVMVAENTQNLLRPTITWRNVEMRNEDMVHIPYILDASSLRGIGPLQLCQAAISVTVEAQEWAANFYADGGVTMAPVIHSAEILGDDPSDPDAETEAERFADAWSAKGNNRPRVVDPRVESIDFPTFNSSGAQMLDARMYQNGEAARMFNIPGTLLEYAMSGSSLTYQNLSTVYEDFLRRCLRPNYLAPIEAAMSDLIPRALVARFDTDNLTLADTKTRYEAYQIGITTGILTVEQAQAFEGIQPGDTDNAPVPFSPPQAIPDALPIQGRSAEIRCLKCNRLLAEVASAPYRFTCPKCKTVNEMAGEQMRVERDAEPPMIIAPTINVPPANVTVTMPDIGDAIDRIGTIAAALNENAISARAQIDRMAPSPDLSDLPERIAAAMPRPEPAPASEVHFHEGAFPRAEVTVPTPEFSYQPPDIHIPATEVTVQPTPVTIDMGPVMAMVTELQARVEQMNAPKQRKVQRDKDGRIIGITEWTEKTA